MAQTKSGQNLRWYFAGSTVGMGRMTMLKPATSRGLETVREAGNDDVVEYVSKVPETTVSFGYNVINKKQWSLALGQTLSASGGLTGAVPEIPSNFDCVERRIKDGTANTYNSLGQSLEVVEGYTIYQLCQWEKDDYDQEVDKIVARSLSAKCKRPVNFEGINGIVFDKFTGDGVTKTFALSKGPTVPLATGQLTIRAESPFQNYLLEFRDYTASSTSSTTSVTFANAPASATSPNVLVVYAY
ncbi:MAG: hypothetical protein NVSMB14_15240 [Isosphaeraceae bacterium]